VVDLALEAADSVDQAPNTVLQFDRVVFVSRVQAGDHICQCLNLACRTDGYTQETGEFFVPASPCSLSDVGSDGRRCPSQL
jgi:hypothetical protein